MKVERAKSAPLSSATLHILLALAGGNLHGYGIIKEVVRNSNGHYKLGPGTLYDNLKKLMAAGLVTDAPPAKSKSASMKEDYWWFYVLTNKGKDARAHKVVAPTKRGEQSQIASSGSEVRKSMKVVSRFGYRLLLGLHPTSFKNEFGAEMLWIFEEEYQRNNACYLFFDAMISLLRQRCRIQSDPGLLSITSGAIITGPAIGPVRLLQAGIAFAVIPLSFMQLLG